MELHALRQFLTKTACNSAWSCWVPPPSQNGGAAAAGADVAEAPSEAPAAAAAVVPRERTQKPAGPAGGAYIPPFKLAQMMRDTEDKEGKVRFFRGKALSS